MITSYKILFAVDLLNDYYADKKCTDISIVPSAETGRLLANQQMLYKRVGNKMVVLVKVKDSSEGADADKPFIPLDNKEKFVFYLRLERPEFSTITNIDTELFSHKRFYFSNIFENKVGTELHLSAQIDNYNNTTAYIPGDMVKNAASVFECIKEITGDNTTNNSFWFDRKENTYSTKKDMYHFRRTNSVFTAKNAASNFTIKVFAFNAATKLYDKAIQLKENSFSSGSPTKNVPVNLSNLSEGRYIIKLNDEDFEGGTDAGGNAIPFYLSDDVNQNRYLGIVEIFNHSAADNLFSLLDANGKVKDVINVQGKSVWLNYLIQFAGKLATWKYVVNTGKVTEIKLKAPTTNPPIYSFTKSVIGQQDIFQSNIPIKLSEKPVMFDVLLTNAVSSQPPPAPNPDPHITGIISRVNTDYFCTMYLFY